MEEEILNGLLNEVSKIKAEHQTGSDFNIFKTLGIESKEVITCRFLGELLNPNGSHGEGVRFLESFLSQVLDCDPLYILHGSSGPSVVLEEQIDAERRVDIVIHGGDYFTSKGTVLPIEVKIWADDQPHQLYDYYHYYFGDDDTKKIYYLTPTGWKPSEKSLTGANGKELPLENVGCLSFGENIKKWLQGINLWLEKRNGFLAGVIEQFIEVIGEMCEKDELDKFLGLKDAEAGKDYLAKQNAAFDLMAQSDVLLKRIRQEHIVKHWDLKEPYTWVPCHDDKQEKQVDSHALIAIKRKDQAIAWICVDTNLYLCCKKVKDAGREFFEGKDSYFWQYIGPDNDKKGKRFNPKKPFDMKNYPKKLEDGDVIRVMELIEKSEGV